MIPTWLPTLALALLVGVPATAGADFWAWETDDGTLAFTDDEKQIPARYKDGAEKRAEQKLVDYPRLTIVPRGATTAPSQPGVGAAPPPAASESPAEPASVRLQLGGNAALEMAADGDEPIVVQRGRFYFDENGHGKMRMIVRQGDRVLAEIDTY